MPTEFVNATSSALTVAGSNALVVSGLRASPASSTTSAVVVAQPSITFSPEMKTEDETRIISTSSSTATTVTVEWVNYQILGSALKSLQQYDEVDNQWKIEDGVYESACYIALNLAAGAFPTPQIFTHGPKSIVFNWCDGRTSRYMTISQNRITVMVSTPERIEKRIEYAMPQLPDKATAFGYLAAAFNQRPSFIKLSGSGIDSDVSEHYR